MEFVDGHDRNEVTVTITTLST